MSGFPLPIGSQQRKALQNKQSLRQKFTPEEDLRLRQLVAELGTKAWKKVSARMPDRSTRQCRERYNNYLSPLLKNDPWTSEEDKLLEEKVKEMGQKWSIIAHFFNGRSDVNVKNRYALLVSKGLAPPGVSFHPSSKKHHTQQNNVAEQCKQTFVQPQPLLFNPPQPVQPAIQEIPQICPPPSQNTTESTNDDPISHIFDAAMSGVEEEEGMFQPVQSTASDWSIFSYDFEADEFFNDETPIIPTTALL